MAVSLGQAKVNLIGFWPEGPVMGPVFLKSAFGHIWMHLYLHTRSLVLVEEGRPLQPSFLYHAFWQSVFCKDSLAIRFAVSP